MVPAPKIKHGYCLKNLRECNPADAAAATVCMKDYQGCLFTLHFWASWAAQCEQMNAVLTELAKDSKLVHVKFVKVCNHCLSLRNVDG